MKLLSFLKRTTKQAQPLGRPDIIALAIGLAVFAGLSLATIAQSSIWFDEAFSAYIIRFNFVEIWQFTAADVHPPLYYWLLKLWSMVFGTTDIALRSMSVFFGGIAAVFGYLLVHRTFGRKAAIYSLLALVLSPILIRYSQEMRMYTLLVAIGFAATYVLQRAMERGTRKQWVLYGVLVSLGMWTHYFAALIWLTHWAWRAMSVARTTKLQTKAFWKKFFSKDWIIAHVVAIGLFVPWIYHAARQLVIVQSGFWIPPVSPVTITNYFTNSTLYLDQNSLNPWLTLGFIMLVGAAISMSVVGYRRLKKQQKPAYWLLIALAFVPPVLLLVASMPPLQSSFIDRYLVMSSLALSMLLGLAMWFSSEHAKRSTAVLIHVLIIGASVVGIASVYHYGNYSKNGNESSGAKQIMSQILDEAAPGEPVVSTNMFIYYDAVFYETADNRVWFVDTGNYPYGSLEMLKTRDYGKIRDTEAFTRDNSTFWYVGRTGEDVPEPPFDARVELIQTKTQPDPVTDKPAYVAAQYRVIAE